jgi:hypothetical protein
MERVPSGSEDWDQLKKAIESDAQLKAEIEWLLQLALETYNPSDRGIRFITGAIGEWLLAFASYAAGVLSLPDGHTANGHDLRSLKARAGEMWSVKSASTIGGNFTITNGRGGAGQGMTTPVVFWSPEFEGMIYADPKVHPWVKEAQHSTSDAMVIPKAAIRAHALANPDCFISVHIPVNPGTATKDPGFEAVKILVEAPQFVRLKKMLVDVEAKEDLTIVSQLRELQKMRAAGNLTDSAYEAAVTRVTSS